MSCDNELGNLVSCSAFSNFDRQGKNEDRKWFPVPVPTPVILGGVIFISVKFFVRIKFNGDMENRAVDISVCDCSFLCHQSSGSVQDVAAVFY